MEAEFNTTWTSKFSCFENISSLKNALTKASELYDSETDGADWLSGTFEPNAVDILAFGIFERLVMLKKTPWHKAYVELDIPDNIFGWVFRMKKH